MMKSVNDIMPMIGARFYTQLEAAQVKCDVLEGELAKVNNKTDLKIQSAFAEEFTYYILL